MTLRWMLFLASLVASLNLMAAPRRKKAKIHTNHRSALTNHQRAKRGVGHPPSRPTGRRKAKASKKRRAYQQAPTPDRYAQIQQALADRGYYHGQTNGQWGPDSVLALRKYQQDHQLDGDGKINSLSLIGLGLGPKRALTAQAAPQPAAPPIPRPNVLQPAPANLPPIQPQQNGPTE